MTGQLGYLRQARVFPQQNLILTVSVSRNELARVLGPGEVAHLRTCVHVLQRLVGQRVPKSYAPLKIKFIHTHYFYKLKNKIETFLKHVF